MRVPEIALLPPLPGGILVENIGGDKGLVLDNQRDPDLVREQRRSRIDQPKLEIINDPFLTISFGAVTVSLSLRPLARWNR